MDKWLLESRGKDNQLDSDPEMNEHDSKEDNMPVEPESSETIQKEIVNIANAVEALNISEGQTVNIDDGHVQVPQKLTNISENAENEAVKIEDDIEPRIFKNMNMEETEFDDFKKAIDPRSLHTCECSAPCEFNIPDLPKLTTKSPSQLREIMNLFSHWNADLSEKFIELLLQLSSERALPDCVPEEKFLRAISLCPNASKLQKKDSTNETRIRVLYQNINGFGQPEVIKDLCNRFLSSDYNVFVITESHLKPTTLSSVFNCYGVSIIRCDKAPVSASGGVTVLYKPPISIVSLTDVTQSDYYKYHRCEMLACLVSTYSGIYNPINLITVYQPPDPSNGGVKQLIEHLKSLLTVNRCVLVGDFNLQKSRTKSNKEVKWNMAIKFFEFLETERKMVQKVPESTMVKFDSKLDLLFVSSDWKEEKATVIEPFKGNNDHKSIEFSIPLTPISITPISRKSYSFETLPVCVEPVRVKSWPDLSPSDLIDWTLVFENCASPSQKYKAFCDRLPAIFASYANSEIAGDKEKADYFRKYFSKDMPDVAQLPRTQTDGHPPVCVCSRIFESVVIQEHLANLPEAQDPSFYLVNENVLRQCSHSVAEPLSLLFTKLLKTTFVPDAWKNYIRKVVPDGTSEAKYNIRYNNDPLADVMNRILCEFIRKTYSCCFSPRQMENHPDESFYTEKDKKLAVVQFDYQAALPKVPQHQLIAEAENIGLHP